MQPLIRCDSGADGIVRMKETESCSICFSAPCCKYSLQQGVFICNYQPPEAVTGFPNHFIWGRVPQGGIFYENQIQHPRINRNRHACCRCHSIDVYGVSHSHHARLYQAGCFGTASLIASFAYGPVAGIVVCLIKNLIKLPSTSTAAVGELFNFVMGALFVGVAGMVYRFKKTRSGAILGAVLGALVMAIVSVPYNYFIVYPAYVVMYHLPLDAIIGMYQAINPNVNGLLNCLLVFNLPFTFFKGMLDAVICFAIYKPLSPILHGRNSGGKSVTA